MNDIPEFGERLKRLRGNRSATEFAKEIGISRVTLGMYESGERLPNGRALKTIAVNCQVSTDYLLGLCDDPRSIIGADEFLHTLMRIRTEMPKVYRMIDYVFEKRVIYE